MKRTCIQLLLTIGLCAANEMPVQAQHIDLDGSWQLKQLGTPHVKGLELQHTATVPGTVQEDLLRLKFISDPYLANNEQSVQWVGLSDWEYSRTFEVSADNLRAVHSELVLEGLDTFATVFINDRELLSADNMYRTWRFEIKRNLHLGTNTIRIDFRSPVYAKLEEAKASSFTMIANGVSTRAAEFGLPTNPYTRKAPFQYGWDFAPRLLTMGIWKPAHIDFWSGTKITRLSILQPDVTADAANVEILASITSDTNRIEILQLTYGPDGSRLRHCEKKITLHAGKNDITLSLNIPKPRLWWPNGYGRQDLYTFRLSDPSDPPNTQQVSTGLRSIVLDRHPDKWGYSFQFIVNGVPIFA